MHRFSTICTATVKAASLALATATILSITASPAAAHDARAQSELHVSAVVLSTCSVASGVQGEAIELDCRDASAPAVETTQPFALGNDGEAVAVTTVNF
jgi:hypothetical protein